MTKQLSLLLLIILTIGCNNNITGYNNSSNSIPPTEESSSEWSNTYELISLLDDIEYNFTNYVIGTGDLSLLQGSITNIGDTTIIPPFIIRVTFSVVNSEGTIIGTCSIPDEIKYYDELPPEAVRSFTFYGWGDCNEYNSFTPTNFSVFKRIWD